MNTSTRSAVSLSMPKLTPLPPGMQIKRLPPGRADGAGLPNEHVRAASDNGKDRVDPGVALMMGASSLRL